MDPVKRSPAPARRTPLVRSEMPARRTPLDRAGSLRRGLFVRRRRLPIDPVWTAVRKVVWERCGHCCERCGRPLDPLHWEGHHRKFRSRGGQHSVTNAVALDAFCHAWVHHGGGRLPAVHGFAVASTDDPAAVPVRLSDGRLVRLTPAGGYAPVPTSEEST